MNFRRLVPVLLLAAACTGNAGKAQTGLELQKLTIEKKAGGQAELEAEIARKPEERSTGLMFRTSLEDGRGMLFVFDEDGVQSFWMKDTLIPLSIAFITYDGIILEIRDMEPRDLRSVLSSRSVRYALEVPQGWFSRAGIAPGDRLNGASR